MNGGGGTRLFSEKTLDFDSSVENEVEVLIEVRSFYKIGQM